MDIRKPEDSAILPFTVWFISIYMVGYFMSFRKWGKKQRGEASSCLISLAHGTPALILSLLSSSHLDLSSPNTAFHNLVLDHSIAYFATDLLHYALLIPTDALFIAHHLATLYVLATCRFAFSHGAVAVLRILALAEVTSLCQNAWTLAGYRRRDSARATALFEFLSPLFYGFYSVVRGILGPLYVCKIGFFFVGSDEIPRWGWVSWIVVMVVGIGLSVFWVLHLWLDLYTRRVNHKKS
ncbi:TLC domain-containing protein At5g14285-like [Salvia miltiorrhiza]|uniref:TLC domain-containing protein At5g14285-like n=1 Tax=Salvia miltiorrhiza TaxID=226208 RepID=UPI0025ACA103|nr:TLC domain-containing protein At5g14285-like [Salvia miltiorrhiza]